MTLDQMLQILYGFFNLCQFQAMESLRKIPDGSLADINFPGDPIEIKTENLEYYESPITYLEINENIVDVSHNLGKKLKDGDLDLEVSKETVKKEKSGMSVEYDESFDCRSRLTLHNIKHEKGPNHLFRHCNSFECSTSVVFFDLYAKS